MSTPSVLYSERRTPSATEATVYTASDIVVVRSIVLTNEDPQRLCKVSVSLVRVASPTFKVRLWNGTVGAEKTEIENMNVAMDSGDSIVTTVVAPHATSVMSMLITGDVG